MSPEFGSLLGDIPPSGTLVVGRKAAALRSRGFDVINLGGGLPSPGATLLEAPIEFPATSNSVGPPAGQPDLRMAISREIAADTGVEYAADGQVVVTVGAKHGVFASLLAIIEPGDEVAVFDPSWVTYRPSVQLAGGKPVAVPMRDGSRFTIDREKLEAAVGPGTKAIIVNTPHNPTGRVLTESELSAIATVAANNDLWVISDESFAKFVFDENQHVSISQLQGMPERTVVLKSFSKAFALPGCRVGYLAGPSELCKRVARLNEHTISCVSPLMQHLALEALKTSASWTVRLKEAYQRKRDMAFDTISDNSSLFANLPEGTFYLFVNIEKVSRDSRGLAERLLEDAHVAVTPGSAFGDEGEGHIRLNLVGDPEQLRRGLQRLVEAL